VDAEIRSRGDGAVTEQVMLDAGFGRLHRGRLLRSVQAFFVRRAPGNADMIPYAKPCGHAATVGMLAEGAQ
jgi:hypothetical protein